MPSEIDDCEAVRVSLVVPMQTHSSVELIVSACASTTCIVFAPMGLNTPNKAMVDYTL